MLEFHTLPFMCYIAYNEHRANHVEYAETFRYLENLGKVHKLCFPVQCVQEIQVVDNNTFVPG